MSNRIGQQLGNYRLVQLLGAGGFAEVYLGQHVRLNQQAAIKVLHAHLTESEAKDFQQEAQTISTLIHPCIIRVFDYDVQEGIPFLVMDYAPNGSLRLRYPRGTNVPLPRLVSYVKQVADALEYAHELKVIHRDVKPENMLLGRHDEVLLSDFGIATIAHSSGSLSTHEATGTLAYMAPEQIEGHPRPASDQYALAVVVYEWLCGARPFEGSPTEVMIQHLSISPPPLHERVTTIPLGAEQVVLRALAKDPKARYASVGEFATALEQASQLAYSPTAQISGEQAAAGSPAAAAFATVAVPGETPADHNTPSGLAGNGAFAATTPAVPFTAAMPAEVPSLTRPRPQRRTIAGLPAALLIGLAILVVAGGVLGSLSLLAHFGVIGVHSSSSALTPVRGGTWSEDIGEPNSFIPNGLSSFNNYSEALVDQALYLPLFYGDAQGLIHPGAATEVPSIQNGGVSADATTWTFHLRPNLVWSDGQPYDARDVDYTWRLWANPRFSTFNTLALTLIASANVSADHRSITFHLKRPFAPFLNDLWVDGFMAPLPAHHFNSMAPEAILKSADLLNPKVVSGPFMMAERVPGDHFTMVRNPRYYRAREGLPYLDKVLFRIPKDENAFFRDLQTGSVTSSLVDLTSVQKVQGISGDTIVTPPTNVDFEALYFNFHNTILATHPEVRQAMAMSIDQQALIDGPLHGFASPLCTDHGTYYHPGYDPGADCPIFDPVAANKLLEDNGWHKGADGVRASGNQRLEFEYSTTPNSIVRPDVQPIIQRDFQAIGIQLDIQNYPGDTFFGPFLSGGKASPPTGAVAGRYDIAEFDLSGWGYDPDDSSLLSCNQIAPNVIFYCNAALDALYQQEQATADPGVRQQIFEQIHQIYLKQLPFITLYSLKILYNVRKGTHNYRPTPWGDTINIWEWWCDGGKC